MRLLVVHRCFWWVGVLVGVLGHALRPTVVTTIGNTALAVLFRCYRHRHAERGEVDDHRGSRVMGWTNFAWRCTSSSQPRVVYPEARNSASSRSRSYSTRFTDAWPTLDH